MKTTPMLYHFSENPAITRFEPRPAPSPGSGQSGLMVWAISAAMQHNYLLPRDCPRVCFCAGPQSSAADVARLIGPGNTAAVIALEWAWLPAVQATTLYRYTLPPHTFALADAEAGYWISREPVEPLAVEVVPNLLAALAAIPVELRLLPTLWPLADAVAASSLRFSIIRMRNALPR